MTVVVKEYNGMEFRDLAVTPSPVKTEVALSVDDKIVTVGPLTFQLHKNAYAYNPELLLSTWNTTYPEPQPRGVGSSPYWRSETILCEVQDLARVREWRDFFFECFTTCDSILKGLLKV